MAHTFGLTSDEFTDISLSTGDYYLVDYTPRTDPNSDTVTESAIIGISASSASDLSDAVRDIQRAFELANRRYDTQTGGRVYIKFQPDGYSAAYRSEIVRPATGEDAASIDYDGDVLGGNWAAKEITAVLTWTRKDYWEANSETELELSNQLTAATTGGISVYNVHQTTGVIMDDASISFYSTGDPTNLFEIHADEIRDTDNNFDFSQHDLIAVSGSDDNDGVYYLVSASSGTLVVGEDLDAEAAGDPINIFNVSNFVDIASSEIDGNLPAYVRLEMRPESTGIETIWMGGHIVKDEYAVGDQFYGIKHYLDTSDALGSTGTSTDSTCSNETKITPTIGTSEERVAYWMFPFDITMGNAGGGYYKVFARWTTGAAETDVKWRVKIGMGTSTGDNFDYVGEQVGYDDTYADTTRNIREIDTIRLPPNGIVEEYDLPGNYYLHLFGKSTTTGSVTPGLDFLMLMPTEFYREYRFIRTIGGASGDSPDLLIDDGINDEVYISGRGLAYNAGTKKNVICKGNKIELYPNKDHRLFFLIHPDSTDGGDYDLESTVKIYYRPRRRTL